MGGAADPKPHVRLMCALRNNGQKKKRLGEGVCVGLLIIFRRFNGKNEVLLVPTSPMCKVSLKTTIQFCRGRI